MVHVGFVGLGDMGGHMARHLVEAGYDLTVFDLDDEAVATLTESGATAAPDARTLAADCDVVFLCLPSHRTVEAVVLGEGGVAGALDAGSVLVDTTTSAPAVTDRVAAAVADSGADPLGAPVSGGRGGAAEGTLTVMVGGDPAVAEAVRPLFETFAASVVHVGDRPSHGHAMKLLNNYLTYVALVATTEVTVAGQRAGLDLETMLDVFNGSSGRNSWTEEKFPEQVVTGAYDTGFPLELARKDVSLGLDYVREQGPGIGLGETVLDAIDASIDGLGADADLARFYEWHRGREPPGH